MSEEISLPPLFSGLPAEDPREAAIAEAQAGTDAGLLAYKIRPDRLDAALVLAPECPLEDAMAMVFAACNGFGDAFGALAPSEVACQFDWPGGIRINGARAGEIRATAASNDPAREPNWLVLTLRLDVFAGADANPGETPDQTTLWEEGCSEIEPARMLESWSRHTLVWINEWLEAGMPKLHRDWLGRAYGQGEAVTLTLPLETANGTFTGLDEKGGLLLTNEGNTRLIPLTAMLDEV